MFSRIPLVVRSLVIQLLSPSVVSCSVVSLSVISPSVVRRSVVASFPLHLGTVSFTYFFKIQMKGRNCGQKSRFVALCKIENVAKFFAKTVQNFMQFRKISLTSLKGQSHYILTFGVFQQTVHLETLNDPLGGFQFFC